MTGRRLGKAEAVTCGREEWLLIYLFLLLKRLNAISCGLLDVPCHDVPRCGVVGRGAGKLLCYRGCALI